MLEYVQMLLMLIHDCKAWFLFHIVMFRDFRYVSRIYTKNF